MYFTEKIGKNGMIEQLLRIAHVCQTKVFAKIYRIQMLLLIEFGRNFSTSKIRIFFLKLDFFSLSWLRDFLKVLAGMSENEELHLQVQIALIVEKLHIFLGVEIVRTTPM